MKLDSVEQLEPSFWAVIESALDQSNDLAQKAMRRFDKLSRKKKRLRPLSQPDQNLRLRRYLEM